LTSATHREHGRPPTTVSKGVRRSRCRRMPLGRIPRTVQCPTPGGYCHGTAGHRMREPDQLAVDFGDRRSRGGVSECPAPEPRPFGHIQTGEKHRRQQIDVGPLQHAKLQAAIRSASSTTARRTRTWTFPPPIVTRPTETGSRRSSVRATAGAACAPGMHADHRADRVRPRMQAQRV